MPAWVNRSQGTTTRNGTTAVTVPFAAATSGNFLVAVLACATTIPTISGWTQPANASRVSNTATYVVTKTATAGESSISLTLGGADYPVNYVVYEYAAGSSFTAARADSPITAGTVWTALTGLPGTAVAVFGVEVHASTNTTTSAAAAWTAPWLEDVDSYQARAGTTDGTHLSVGYQDGVTATSATPDGVSTFGGTTITGERIVFALTPVVVPSSQTAAPASDITTTGWTKTPSGAATFAATLDEATADDTDYVSSPASPTASPFEVKLQSLTDPQNDTGHTVSYRFRSTGASSSVVVGLYQGATLIRSQTVASNPSAFTTGTFTLTTAEASNITDYTDLRIRVTATAA